MKNNKSAQIKIGRARRRERGVALIATLLLLLLVTAMSIAMVLSANSDMLINGYYRNYRGAFYAADSGLNIARQELFNQINAAKLEDFSPTTSPIPTGTASAVQTYIANTYRSFRNLTGNGQASSSWPEKFKITNVSLTQPAAPNDCVVIGGGGTCAAPTGSVTGYRYTYNYSLTAVGQSQGTESATIQDSGTLIINATLVPDSGIKKSFAAYGMFIDENTICNGSTLVPGTISGPVFTNGAWTFGTSGKYIFTDSVGSVSSKFGYQFNNCQQSSATSYKSGNTTIAPTYQVAPKLGQNKVPLPTNDFNQLRAALDGKGTEDTQPTNSEKNSVLRDVNKGKYPTSGASSGVYLPYTVDGSGNAIFTGGGIYVKGDAKVTLSPGGSAGIEIYTITQGSGHSAVTTTITVNNSANTTTMSSTASGSPSVTISGVPQVRDPNTGNPTSNATMLYVDGNITSLSGPAQNQPAIQDGVALTITAAEDVTITGDIIYKSEPVTLTQNQIPGTPADTLIDANDHGQALGIFTAKGDIQLDNKQSDNNLQIDASLATISDPTIPGYGNGGLVNTGKQIDTLTIVGGRIQNQIKNINSTTRNVFFDRRYANNDFAPPWFPSTTITSTGTDDADLTPSFQRTQWLNLTSSY
jgi:Tfp pilus assembly protein PilX